MLELLDLFIKIFLLCIFVVSVLNEFLLQPKQLLVGLLTALRLASQLVLKQLEAFKVVYFCGLLFFCEPIAMLSDLVIRHH